MFIGACKGFGWVERSKRVNRMRYSLQALAHLRVLDLSRVLAGTLFLNGIFSCSLGFCTFLLNE